MDARRVDPVGRDALIVFLKRPAPGEVKTRLMPDLGASDAAHLYRLLAEEEMRQTVPLAGEYAREIFFAPREAGAEIEAWLTGETCRPQIAGDLGARMAAAFEEVFARGVRRAALIGTDVPWLSRRDVIGALNALDEADVVLGPAEDGGYYLVALRRPVPELFSGIEWSTSTVLQATLARARTLRQTVHLLPVRRDIDRLEDIRAEWPALRALLARDPELLARLEALLSARASRARG